MDGWMAKKKIVAEGKREVGKEGRSSRSLLKGALIERQEKNESKRSACPRPRVRARAGLLTSSVIMQPRSKTKINLFELGVDIFTFAVP